MVNIIKEDINKILSNEIIEWERFSGKTVLVTGANGMLPSYMVYTLLMLNKIQLISHPVKVLALVRNQTKAEIVFDSWLNDANLEFIIQDVSSPFTYKKKIDYIIHAASQASPKYYGTDPVGTLNANIMGTHYLLEFAKEKGIEAFLFFSTGGVYGEIDSSKMPMKEEDSGYLNCLKVRNCYFESKRMAENMCVSYAFQYGVQAKIVRVFHTYGPKMDLNDGRAFSDFCKNIINGEDIILHSDGSAQRTFCYITDAVCAYFKVLLDGISGTAYNVGNPNTEICIKDLAETLVNLYPEKGLNVRFDIDNQSITYGAMKSPVKRTVPDVCKCMALGWKPMVSIEEGFKRTIDSKILEK